MKITHAAQLARDPAFLYFAAKCGELFGGSIARTQCFQNRMRRPSCVDASRRHFPKFLYPDAIDLRIEPVEILLANELLGQGSARTLRQHGDLGADFITRREVVFGLSIFVPAFVLRNYASDAFALVNQLRTGELREDVDARLLRKSTEPLRQLAQRDDVIAVIS